MRFRVINENTLGDAIVGSAFWAGRGWLSSGMRDWFNAEWFLLHKAKRGPNCTLELGSGDGDDVLLHLAFPWLFNVYLVFKNVLSNKSRFVGHNNARQVGVHYFEGVIHLHVWSRGGMGDWSSKDPWWLHGFRLDLDWLIFGRRQYSETGDTGWKDTEIPMPEGCYLGKIRLYTSEWRSRFGTKRLRRAEIQCTPGIPFPGKGESEWDCGEDATHSITCPADNEWDAIGALVASVMRSRLKYGGANWRPKATITTGTIRLPDVPEAVGNGSGQTQDKAVAL